MRPIRRTSENKISPGRVVEYQQHGKALLAVALREKKSKWLLVNQDGAELELSADRLYLFPGNVPESESSTRHKAEYLQNVSRRASALAQEADLEEAWQLLGESGREIGLQELTELLLNEDGLETRLATRRLLLADQVYFKRKKNGLFEARSANAVDELLKKQAVEQQKREQRRTLVAAIIERLRNPDAPLPAGLDPLEQLAAFGKSADSAKETIDLLEEVQLAAQRSFSGPHQDKAFRLLVELGKFSPYQHLTPVRLGRPITFSEKEQAAAEELLGKALGSNDPDRHDCRNLLVFTVDGAETRDFDDALSLEKTEDGYRVGIHISDVAAIIETDSILEATAFRRGTSIYCPDVQYPMLPTSLSEGLLSLNEGTTRPALSAFIDFDSSRSVVAREMKRTLISIDHRLTYDQADAILCDGQQSDSPLHDILLTLWDLVKSYEHSRVEAGATQFTRKEKTPLVDAEGHVRLQGPEAEDTPARQLVGELMVLTNETAALLAAENDFPLIFRSQEPPEVELADQGMHIPPGPAREFFQRSFFKRSTLRLDPAWHFGLGLPAYAQVTSPIRRALDLVNQRQLAAFVQSHPLPYTAEDIQGCLGRIEQGLDEAFQIQRERNRFWLLRYLQQEKIETLEATVMKNDGSRPLAEVDTIFSMFFFHPREGYSPQLGERVTLKIDKINPRKDSIQLRQL